MIRDVAKLDKHPDMVAVLIELGMVLMEFHVSE